MGGHVNFVYDLGGEENPDELKHFLFLESVRLSQEKQELAEERKRIEFERKKLAREKDLFDKQWKIVEREKANLKRMQQQQRSAAANVTVRTGTYFAGVTGTAGLRKRYRDLLKIYHPDNGNGDSATLLAINKEYESVKKQFGIY